MAKKILQCCVLGAAAISMVGCGGSSNSDPAPGPDKSALWKDTLENVARLLWLPAYDEAKVPAEIRQHLNDAKNSPETVGQNTKNFIDDLMKNPDSCSPDNSERLALLRKYSDKLNPHQAYAMRNLFGKDSSRGYSTIPSSIDFNFPAADAPQNTFQVGWHFFVGSAYSQSGEEFGVQMMFWHYAMLPPAMAHKAGLTDMENQVTEMHLAVSRAGDRHYRTQPYVVSGTTGLSKFSQAPFNYQLGKNAMLSRKADALFPIDLTAGGLDERQANNPVEMKINIGLTQSEGKGYILNGDKGLSPSCGEVGTLYYSVPNLRVDPKASWIQLGNEKIQLASGKFWYDHQYGTGMMPSGNPRTAALRAMTNVKEAVEGQDPGGWDWLMLQFDDNTEMTLAALHTKENKSFYQQTGSTAPGTMKSPVKGSFILQDGSYKDITGSIEVPQWIKSDVKYGPYMASNTWYPDRVKVMVNSPDIAHKEVYMVPIVKTGQQGYFANGLEYSEGAVYLEDANGKKIGRGFLESTGYADSTQQILALSGIPVNAENIKIMQPSVLKGAQLAACAQSLQQPEFAAQAAKEYLQCRGL